jgi:CRISPR/Cas system-associated protein Cas7 (RAMP superfamily)
LIKEVTESNGTKNETGTGVGQATAAASGSATVKIAENGSGNANGVVNTTIDNSTTTIINGASGNAVVKKVSYRSTRHGDQGKLHEITTRFENGKIVEESGVISSFVFNEKKGKLTWNGHKIKKNVSKVAFIDDKSHNLLVIFKNGNAYRYPAGKGNAKRKLLAKNVKTYKASNKAHNQGLATTLVKKGKKRQACQNCWQVIFEIKS